MKLNDDPEKFLHTFHKWVGRGDPYEQTGIYTHCPFATEADAYTYLRAKLIDINTHLSRRNLLRWYEYLGLNHRLLQAMRACAAARDFAMTEWIMIPSEVPRSPYKTDGLEFYISSIMDRLKADPLSDEDVNFIAIQLSRLYRVLHRHDKFFEAWKRAKMNSQKQTWEHNDTDQRAYEFYFHRVPVDKMW